MLNENTPTIKTERLILRKFETSDVNALFEILSEKETNIYLPWFILKSKNEAVDFLESRFLDYYKKERAYRYAICLKDDNKPIGYACVSDDDSCDFGYGLKQIFWNKGITTEAAQAVLGKIKSAGYQYITATHDINNYFSGKVMKKLGMIYKYSYVENWQPKNISVTFRMYSSISTEIMKEHI